MRQAVTRRSGARIARSTSRRTSRSGRRKLDLVIFRRRRSIGLLPASRRVTRGRGAIPRTSPRDEDPARLKKNLARSCTADGSAVTAPPATGGATVAEASETMGARETATVSTPSRSSRLARRPLSPERERPEERGDRACDRERSQ